MGEGLILAPGALDANVHFICPQPAWEAIAEGISTISLISILTISKEHV